MALTPHEMRVAADRARHYPPGRGYSWGSEPWFEEEPLEEISLRLRRDPPLRAYG